MTLAHFAKTKKQQNVNFKIWSYPLHVFGYATSNGGVNNTLHLKHASRWKKTSNYIAQTFQIKNEKTKTIDLMQMPWNEYVLEIYLDSNNVDHFPNQHLALGRCQLRRGTPSRFHLGGNKLRERWRRKRGCRGTCGRLLMPGEGGRYT